MILDFFLAKQKHRMWMINMKAYLLDIEDFDASKVAAHTQCDLGKWIYGFAINEFSQFAEFVRLESIHKDLHTNILDIISAKEKGDFEQANQLFLQLENTSLEILGLLDKMEQITAAN